MKPDIVFFGEQLPAAFYYYMVDMPQADLLIVMGSSLEVKYQYNIYFCFPSISIIRYNIFFIILDSLLR